jgi:hypothetical protein
MIFYISQNEGTIKQEIRPAVLTTKKNWGPVQY